MKPTEQSLGQVASESRSGDARIDARNLACYRAQVRSSFTLLQSDRATPFIPLTLPEVHGARCFARYLPLGIYPKTSCDQSNQKQ